MLVSNIVCGNSCRPVQRTRTQRWRFLSSGFPFAYTMLDAQNLAPTASSHLGLQEGNPDGRDGTGLTPSCQLLNRDKHWEAPILVSPNPIADAHA